MTDAPQTVELEFFAGKQFTLTAVDTSKTFPVEYSADSGGVAFTLDGVTYAAVENPDDGYRSSMDRIAILPTNTEMSTVIAPHIMVGRHLKQAEDIIELIDIKSGKAVLRFGTGDTDDYYPYFVGEFDPTALAANQAA